MIKGAAKLLLCLRLARERSLFFSLFMTITIYSDSNIYRYVARGELEVITVGSVRFAYSSVHFDEMIRTGNLEMLEGIK